MTSLSIPPQAIHPGLLCGRLVALEQHDSLNWLCGCTCGRFALVRSDALSHSRIHSCGCIEKENAKNASS